MLNNDKTDLLATNTSYSGSDLIMTFGKAIVGSLQQISWGIQREKVPVFVCGDPNPKSFSRGKRGIAGSLVLATFDEDALLKEMKNIWDEIAPPAMFTGAARTFINRKDALEKAIYNVNGTQVVIDQSKTNVSGIQIPEKFGLITKENVQYADQIPPFDVTLTFANEYGQASFMKIYDLEILNEASGVSVDMNVMEKQYTWIARSISPLYKGVYNGNKK
jgi:hypothetical protein